MNRIAQLSMLSRSRLQGCSAFWPLHGSTASMWTSSSATADDNGANSDLQVQVLSAALEHVHTLGWTVEAMRQAAADLDLSPAVAGSFPRREGHLVEYFNAMCNRKLEAALAEQRGELQSLSVQQRLVKGARMRLEMVTPYLSCWSEALAVQARPQQVPHTLRSYSNIADIIWRASGDSSTDFSWYTRRGVLVASYMATELSLLTDSSPGFQETWAL